MNSSNAKKSFLADLEIAIEKYPEVAMPLTCFLYALSVSLGFHFNANPILLHAYALAITAITATILFVITGANAFEEAWRFYFKKAALLASIILMILPFLTIFSILSGLSELVPLLIISESGLLFGILIVYSSNRAWKSISSSKTQSRVLGSSDELGFTGFFLGLNLYILFVAFGVINVQSSLPYILLVSVPVVNIVAFDRLSKRAKTASSGILFIGMLLFAILIVPIFAAQAEGRRVAVPMFIAALLVFGVAFSLGILGLIVSIFIGIEGGYQLGRLISIPVVDAWCRHQLDSGHAALSLVKTNHRNANEHFLSSISLDTQSLSITLDALAPGRSGQLLVIDANPGEKITWKSEDSWGGEKGPMDINHLLFCNQLTEFRLPPERSHNNIEFEAAVLPDEKWLPRGTRHQNFRIVGPRLKYLPNLLKFDEALGRMQHTARRLNASMRIVQNSWLLEALGLKMYWDLASDAMKSIKSKRHSAQNLESLQVLLREHLTEQLHSHLKKRGSSHFLDVEVMKDDPNLMRLIPLVLENRAKELDGVEVTIDRTENTMDLRPLWLTAHGFMLLSKTDLGLTSDLSNLRKLTELMDTLGIRLRTKTGRVNQKKIPRTWSRMTKAQKQFILYFSHIEQREQRQQS